MMKHVIAISLLLMQQIYAVTVKKEQVNQAVLLKGQLASTTNHNIYNMSDAVLTPLHTKGQYVHEGEDIFIIDNAQNTRQILESIQSYFQAEVELKLNKNQLLADTELFEANAISYKKYQESHLEHQKKELNLIKQQDTLEEQLHRFNKTLDDISQFKEMSITDLYHHIYQHMPQTIQSPINGYFLPESEHSKFFKKESSAGHIVNHDAFYAKIELNERQVNQVKNGQDVTVNIPSIKKKMVGYIHHVVPYPTSEKGNASYEAVVHIDQLDTSDQALIKNGMECIVSVTTQQQTSLIIPLSSVKNIAHQDYVITVKNNQHKLEPVRLGATSGMNVIVLSGLKEGDEIIEHH